ncbi:hypothetical protein [Granulicella mallensis]|uniref:Uncharacterized protein n=1 Tax=Granulicella mallensis (strain ATCC BAA-1857 / DSM 23137 / MP5ACTX8) TaxID=682795 RepID=G8NWN2_GRAMM|nr:hypothetical protein [Granulicella mallensis]AEU38919.1 hypothetical protein AciX8_4649 [Granulicella mallensis MP5ACTX8]
MNENTLETVNKRPRLSPQPTFAPWIPAPESAIADASLFWLPVSGFPLRYAERQWLLLFLERFSAALTQSGKLRCEHFMQQNEIRGPLHHSYHQYKERCVIYPGLGRSMSGGTTLFPPDGAPATQPEENEKHGERIGQSLLWFANKQPIPQRELFAGYGGFIALFLPPDPKPKVRPPNMAISPALRAAHPAFQRFDVEQIVSGTAARLDAFLDRSKTLFGSDLAHRAELRRMDFVLPLLDSATVFGASPEERSLYFELFDVYVGESRKDKGVVLLFQKPEYEQVMLDVVATMPPAEEPVRR